MIYFKKHILKISVVAFATTLFFGCKDNLKNVQQFTITEFMPTGEADSIHLKYTDSGRVKTILVSPKMKEYSSVMHPFTEFPKHVHITLIDENGQANYIEADYAKIYKETEVIDFRGNVKLTSHQGHFLETEQLFYDQKKEWFFTKQKFKFTAPGEGETLGMGIDFSKDFQRIDFKNVNGIIEKLE